MLFDSPIIPKEKVILKEPLSEVNQKREKKHTHFSKEVLKSIVKEYQTQGEKIIANAQQKAKIIHNQAYEEGFNKGYTEGLKYIENIYSNLSKIIESIQESKREYFESLYPILKELLIKILTEIVMILPEKDKKIIQERLRFAFEKLSKETITEITLSKSDYAFLKENLSKIKKELPELENVKLKFSGQLNSGDVKISTDKGKIDMLIKEELGKIIEVIRKE